MKSWFKTKKYEKLIQNDKVWKVNSKRQSMKSWDKTTENEKSWKTPTKAWKVEATKAK